MSRQKITLILSQKLSQLMFEKRIRLGQLAQDTGISKSTLHNWRYGGNPGDLFALKHLADYFAISVDELCFGMQTRESNNLQPEDQDLLPKDGVNIGLFDVILLKRQK